MFEHHQQPLIPLANFLLRMMRSVLAALVVFAGTLGLGMAGYHHFEKLGWVDAYVNASMILSGMGPVSNLQTDAGKIFAGSYALFSGLAFAAILGFLLAPVIHRGMHKFHISQHHAHHPGTSSGGHATDRSSGPAGDMGP